MRHLAMSCALALTVAGCAANAPATKPPASTLPASPADYHGVAIAYHAFGSGPVVLAHPGGPGIEWKYLRMPELEKVATVVYIEPFGTGESGRLADPSGYTLAHYVEAVEAVRVRLGIDRVVLLGHSHGGFVAQSYALAHPEHLRGLVLYDTSPTTSKEWQQDVESNLRWFEHEPWFPAAAAALANEAHETGDEQATENLKVELPLYFAEWTARSAEYEPLRQEVRLWTAPSKSEPPPDNGNVGVAPPFDVRGRLHEIATPTVVLVGKKDFVCSEKMANLIHGGIAGSKLVLLARSGHMGHIEEPTAFTSAVAGFLAGLAR